VHITFQINRIVSIERVLYNGDFKNIVSKKTRLKFEHCSKQHKKIFIFYLQSVTSPYKHSSCSSTEILQFVFFHMLIFHGSNLGLRRALCIVHFDRK